MDEDKPIPSEKNEFKVVEPENIANMTESEIERYTKGPWEKITPDRGQE